MSDDDYKKSGDEEDESGQGAGGQSGSGIAFRDFTESATAKRDDFLNPSEIKRLLGVHKELSARLIEKAKELKEVREKLKELVRNGKLSRATYRQQGGHAELTQENNFNPHPHLWDKVPYVGRNPVNQLPSNSTANTNEEARHTNELKYTPKQQPRLHHTPRYTPNKPTPFG